MAGAGGQRRSASWSPHQLKQKEIPEEKMSFASNENVKCNRHVQQKPKR
jgi:hypothetical protein